MTVCHLLYRGSLKLSQIDNGWQSQLQSSVTLKHHSWTWGDDRHWKVHTWQCMKSSLHPTLLTVLPSVAHRALTDVRVPLVDARASILAPIGFTIVPLCCTACSSGKPLLCMLLIRKRLWMTVFEFLCKKKKWALLVWAFCCFFNIFEASEAKCGWQKFMWADHASNT